MIPQRSTVPSRGVDLVLWTWLPAQPSGAPTQPKGTVVVFHGLGAHGRFPSVRIAAELLVEQNYRVCAIDFPGHGESPGLRGYIESADALVADGVNAAEAAASDGPGASAMPLFLLGSSMGGAIAVEVASALAAQGRVVAGMVLLAPMLGPAADDASRLLVTALAWTPLARLPLIPFGSGDSTKQYSDPEIRRSVDADELAYHGSLRVASAAAVLELGRRVEANVVHVSAPFFCLLADREVVLGPRSRAAAERLMQEAATPLADRATKTYDALHGILCELPEARSAIAADIVEWLKTKGAGPV